MRLIVWLACPDGIRIPTLNIRFRAYSSVEPETGVRGVQGVPLCRRRYQTSNSAPGRESLSRSRLARPCPSSLTRGAGSVSTCPGDSSSPQSELSARWRRCLCCSKPSLPGGHSPSQSSQRVNISMRCPTISLEISRSSVLRSLSMVACLNSPILKHLTQTV